MERIGFNTGATTISADSMQASAAMFSFAIDFSQWRTPFTIPVSRLQPGSLLFAIDFSRW